MRGAMPSHGVLVLCIRWDGDVSARGISAMGSLFGRTVRVDVTPWRLGPMNDTVLTLWLNGRWREMEKDLSHG